MARIKSYPKIHGWIIIDKPAAMLSTKAMSVIQHLTRAQKIGHGGTLDPFATGILPIAMGEATKATQYILHGDKTYEFSVQFGVATDSADGDGKIIAQNDQIPTAQAIADIMPQFMGTQMQIPPNYSALKVKGERAYNLARAGVDFELDAREITIYDCEFLGLDGAVGHFRAKVSKGTYIRTLGVDIAQKLGCLGFVCTLRRTKIANFSLDDAFSLDFCEKLASKDRLDEAILGLDAGLDGISAVALTPQEAASLRLGRAVGLVKKSDGLRFTQMQEGKIYCAKTASYPPEMLDFIGFVRREKFQIIAERLFTFS